MRHSHLLIWVQNVLWQRQKNVLFDPLPAGLATTTITGPLDHIPSQRSWRITWSQIGLPDPGNRMEGFFSGASALVILWKLRIVSRRAVLFPQPPEERTLQASKIGPDVPTTPVIILLAYGVTFGPRSPVFLD
jgi:hypothetical protein